MDRRIRKDNIYTYYNYEVIKERRCPLLNGLMLYRQYLENIRLSISNYDLPELESKDYLMVLKRVKDIEDLSYIDVILKNAGLDLSFMGDKDFLDKPVKLASKLDKLFKEDSEVDNEMQDALSEYLTGFMSKEDEVLSKIDSILGEKGVSSISSECFPRSESPILDSASLLEHHKDTLSGLFKGLSALSEKPEEQENEEVEEPEKNEEPKVEISMEETDTGLNEDLDEDLVVLDEPENLEETVQSKALKKPFKLDTSFLNDDIEETKAEESKVENKVENNKEAINDSDEDDKYWSEDRDFSMFLDSDTEFEDKEEDSFASFLDSETPVRKYRGITQKELDEEVNKLYPEEDYTTDPIINQFEDATNYFLTGKHKDSSDLSELYKSKEKIVDIDDVSNLDDSLAKLLLAMGDGVLKMPNMTVKLFKKLKENSRKLKENMIVGDEDDEEED